MELTINDFGAAYRSAQRPESGISAAREAPLTALARARRRADPTPLAPR